MKAEESAYSYVKKHGFDNEIRDTCWACYHDGFIEGKKSQLQALKQRLDDYKAHPIVKRRNGEEFKLYGFISIEEAKRIITDLEDND